MRIALDYDDSLDAPTLTKALGAIAFARHLEEPLGEMLAKGGQQGEPIPELYMAQLAAQFAHEGRELDDLCIANVGRWIAHATREPLVKARGAGRPRQLWLSQQQIDELILLIRLHYRVALTANIGGDWDIDQLTERRWKVARIIRPEVNLAGKIGDALIAGRLKQILDDGATIGEMQHMAREFPMTREVSLTLQAVTNQARYDLSGNLGYKMEQQTVALVQQQNAERIADIVTAYRTGDLKHTPTNRAGVTPEEMQLIQTDKAVAGWRGLGRELRNRMAGVDRDRDWDRVAVSSLRYSKNMGTLGALAEDGAAFVYYMVNPHACQYCQKLYLEPGGKPKVFALSELMTNIRVTGGSNRGRLASKIGDPDRGWLPTALAHPWCQCRPFRAIKGVHY